ncbi:enoyl-CoA hydratase/isomerase family protein [Natronorubrum halophilum]|uniref:enoyl-CoA hydratase/isomerase family protein n=1 Tax=Natronorubrum halophilum TaxID=1702106 RepID=UPI000EF69568|nr:enoyl-CoA hydratase-related protein [Natronorubrum halophilum]
MCDTDYDNVYIEREDSLATIYVDRPEVRNSVNLDTIVEITNAIKKVGRDEKTRVIVLTGHGERAFIGGGDIKQFQDKSGIWFQREFRPATHDLERAIEESMHPVLAAVNGDALGGGTEIAMMCDMIVAAASARFGQPEIRLGIIPNAGGTQRLAHLVGSLKAKELILTGRHISAEEAADIGLINEVVSDDAFEERVCELAAELAAGPALAQWFGKRAVNATRTNLNTGLQLEAALSGLLFNTRDKEEGMGAFFEDRDPNFEGYSKDEDGRNQS